MNSLHRGLKGFDSIHRSAAQTKMYSNPVVATLCALVLNVRRARGRYVAWQMSSKNPMIAGTIQVGRT
jgi:hypothetical protein